MVVKQAPQEALQKRMTLDYVFLTQEGIHVLVNTICCTNAGQYQPIEMDVYNIQSKLQTMYEITGEKLFVCWGRLPDMER